MLTFTESEWSRNRVGIRVKIMIRVWFELVNRNRLIAVVITQCVYIQKSKILEYMGLLWEVGISPKLKLYKYSLLSWRKCWFCGFTIYCMYGNSGSYYWLVTKVAEKIYFTILTDALYYSLFFLLHYLILLHHLFNITTLPFFLAC